MHLLFCLVGRRNWQKEKEINILSMTLLCFHSKYDAFTNVETNLDRCSDFVQNMCVCVCVCS